LRDKFGFVPPFFGPALQTPDVGRNLWQQGRYLRIISSVALVPKEEALMPLALLPASLLHDLPQLFLASP